MKLYLIFLINLFNSCSIPKIDKISIEQALSMSGENRGELENILKHYQNNPKQLTASQSLIRNMKSCFSGFFKMVYQIRSIIF